MTEGILHTRDGGTVTGGTYQSGTVTRRDTSYRKSWEQRQDTSYRRCREMSGDYWTLELALLTIITMFGLIAIK